MQKSSNRSAPRVTFLFHLTDSANLPSIQEKGLDPGFSRGGRAVIYLGGDAPHVMAYFDHHGDWGGRPLLLGISLEQLHASQLGPDDVDLPDLLAGRRIRKHWSELSWQQSLGLCGLCTYNAIIPFSACQVLQISPGSSLSLRERPL